MYIYLKAQIVITLLYHIKSRTTFAEFFAYLLQRGVFFVEIGVKVVYLAIRLVK